jgi:hypothetical protein
MRLDLTFEHRLLALSHLRQIDRDGTGRSTELRCARRAA